MKVGLEICHGFVEDIGFDDFVPVFDRVKDFGSAGMYIKSPQYISPDLDLGKLRSARQYADELGLYLEYGLGRVNPYNTYEAPKVWLLGNGSYRLAMERIIAAAAEAGCHNLLGVTGGFKRIHSGNYCYDRFRSDAPWEDQLHATEKFLKTLAPCLRQYGSRVNLETHEEITSFEVVRLVEAVGDDVVGVAFDTGNVLPRGEDPVAAARRVAPYCNQMHVKDAILFFSENGLVRQMRPCGDGIINWKSLLQILYEHNPNLNLNLEDYKNFLMIDMFTEEWRSGQPDFNLAEMGELIRLARESELKVARGEIMNIKDYEAIPYKQQMKERFCTSMNYLNGLLDTMNFR